jgi:hypothetical protein
MAKPFQKDDPRINRSGRPKKGESLTDILRELGGIADVSTEKGKIERRQAIANRLWQMAIAGDLAAIKMIYDRIDGSPRQSVEMTGTDGAKLMPEKITIEIVDPKKPKKGIATNDTL